MAYSFGKSGPVIADFSQLIYIMYAHAIFYVFRTDVANKRKTVFLLRWLAVDLQKRSKLFLVNTCG